MLPKIIFTIFLVPFVRIPSPGKIAKEQEEEFRGQEPYQIFTLQAVAQSRKISSGTPTIHSEKIKEVYITEAKCIYELIFAQIQ